MTPPKRLLFVSMEFPPGPGGLGVHAYEVCRHLHNVGWTVTALTRQDYHTPEEIEQWNAGQPFRVHTVRLSGNPVGNGIARLMDLRALIRRDRPSVIIASGERSAWVVAPAAAASGIPWVAIAHGTEFRLPTRRGRFLNSLVFSRADLIISVSDYTRQVLKDVGIRPRSVIVIHNGAHGDSYAPLPDDEVRTFAARRGVPPGRILLTVGRVSERKGQQTVIKALPRILAAVPDVHYLIVGLPVLQAKLEDLARDLGVDAHVHFMGVAPPAELKLYLNACDVFIMSSRITKIGDYEGFGIAVVEAALCGKPAVVSSDSGLAEAIIDGVTGIGVPSDNPAALANAVIDLLTHPDRLRSMGEAALRDARAHRTWDVKIKEYDDVLTNLIRRPHTAQSAVPGRTP